MDVKELFAKAENGTLTYEQFVAAASEANAKFADLSEGKYVSKSKYEDDLSAKTREIETLSGTISTRDSDLDTLKKQLEAAGTDAGKLKDLNDQLSTLQNTYTETTKKYEEQLARQAYEFAVKEFAATKKFTSNAAKRDFTQSMISENLKFKNNQILGAEDFVKAYTESNADAFVKEPVSEGGSQGAEQQSLPRFSGPASGGQSSQGNSNAFADAFHFTPIRPIPQK